MIFKSIAILFVAMFSLSSCGGGISDLPPVVPSPVVYDMTKFLPFGKHLNVTILPANHVEYKVSGAQNMQISWGDLSLARHDMENYRYDDFWIYLDSFEWSDNGYKFPIIMTKMELKVNGVPVNYPAPNGTPWAPRFVTDNEVYQLTQWGDIKNIQGDVETRYAATSVFGFGGLITNSCFIPSSESTKMTLTQVEAWLDEPVGSPGTGVWKWLTNGSGPAYNIKGEPLPITGTPTRKNWMAEGIGHLWKFDESGMVMCVQSVI